MSIPSALLLAHLASTAVLLAVLILIVVGQSLGHLATRLHRRWTPIRRGTAHATPAPSAAAARFSGVDRRQPLHSSS